MTGAVAQIKGLGRRGPRAGAMPVYDRREVAAREEKERLEKEAAGVCGICLDTPGKEAVCPCGARFCRPCLVAYAEAEMCSDKFSAHAKPLRCPACMTAVRYARWGGLSFEASRAYVARAKASLSLQCGQCDQRETLLPAVSWPLGKEARRVLAQFPEVLAQLRAFAVGEGSPGTLADVLFAVHASPDSGLTAAERNQIEPEAVAKSITDPERRAQLLVAVYMRAPCVVTECCQAPHCFRCKVRDAHATPDDCRAYREANYGGEFHEMDVRECPECLVAVVRSEGCNSIQCLCGNHFNFGQARKLV